MLLPFCVFVKNMITLTDQSLIPQLYQNQISPWQMNKNIYF